MTRLKRPRDPNQLAALIVGISTGEVEDKPKSDKNPAAVELGRLGGQKRAATLSKARRMEIAKKASAARKLKK